MFYRYCLGLMQGVWIEQLNITTSEASLINSVTFAITLLPAPAIQAARDYFNIPPFVVFALTAPLVASGLYFTSTALTFQHLLLTNGVGFGLGILLAITGGLTTVYHFFLDDMVTFVTSVVSSGVGLGMIAISMAFKFLEPNIGWRQLCRYQILLVSVYIFAALIFFPPISTLLGIKTRKERKREQKKFERQEQLSRMETNENQKLLSSDKDVSEAEDYSKTESRDYLASNQISDSDQENSASLIMRANNMTITDSIRVKTTQLWKEVLLNPPFLLLMTSWLLSEATFNAVMVHQPQRIVHMGFSLANGADTLAISGAVQIVARFGVGFLADRGILSIVRLSQLSKVTLGVFCILSNIFPNLAFQSIYMFIVGACGGILSTTDFILVKDCVNEGRELGITVLLLVDGIFSLLSIAGAGKMATSFNDYDVVFYTFGACSLLAFTLVVFLDILMKLKKRPTKLYDSLDQD